MLASWTSLPLTWKQADNCFMPINRWYLDIGYSILIYRVQDAQKGS